MKFRISYDSLDILKIPKWERVFNDDGTTDIYGISEKKTTSGAEYRSVVCVKDVDNLTDNGTWNFCIWLNIQGSEDDTLISKLVESKEPDTQSIGYFGYMSVNLLDFIKRFTYNNIPVIAAIVGESGSGKTTLSLELEKYGIPTLVSYTTRPMRNGEVNGREHWFVTEDEMPDKSQMLAYTYFGNNHYWTDVNDLKKHPVVSYVIDEAGIIDLYERKKKGELDVCYIYVQRKNNPTDDERKNRDECRTDAQEILKSRDIKPHIIIDNDYPDLQSFLDKESKNLATIIKFVAGYDEEKEQQKS